jgi:hypothetical protein
MDKGHLKAPCPNAIFLVFDWLMNSSANRSRSTASKTSSYLDGHGKQQLR